jgi:translocation and assembly module TamB
LLTAAGVLVLGLLYTAPGHSTVAWLIGNLSNGNVRVRGLSGNLPNVLHARSVEISDVKGVWFRVENLSLDWSALAALNNRFTIRRVSASRAIVLRRPEREKSTGESPQIDIESLVVPRIEIATPVIGRAALLRADGSFHYTSLHQLSADLSVSRLGSDDRYRIRGGIDNDVVRGTASVVEGAGGILAALLGFPGLAPVNATAQAGGDARANTIKFQISAGALRASGGGMFSIVRRSADVDFSAVAPAMQPSVDVAWRSLSLDGHMRGAIDKPRVTGRLQVSDARISGSRVGELVADVSGDRGKLDLSGRATAVQIPGVKPDLIAQSPVGIKAHADLNRPSRPVTFSLSHKLMAITGSADTRGASRLSADVAIPSLAPLAALAGEDVPGSARVNLKLEQTKDSLAVAFQGRLRVEGKSMVARLLGTDATVSLQASLAGTDIRDSRVIVSGAGVQTEASGNFRNQVLNYTARVRFPQLSRLADTLRGDLALSGHIMGPLGSAAITAHGDASIASKGFTPERIGIDVRATGFPRPGTAQVRIAGRLDGSPVSIDGDLTKTGNEQGAKLKADWKSVHVNTDVVLPRSRVATGVIAIQVGRLEDLASFVGTRLAGTLVATTRLAVQGPKSSAAVTAHASGVSFGQTRLGAATASGVVGDPFGKPSVSLTVVAENLEAPGIGGNGVLRLEGPEDRLGAMLRSDLHDADGNPVHATASAAVDVPKRRLVLQTFEAHWREQAVTLRMPATFDLAGGVAVDRIAATIGGGEIDIAGRAAPRLSLAAEVRGIQVAALHPFAPGISAEGTLSGAVHLTGTPDAPTGTFDIEGRGLRASGYSEKVVTAANLDVHGTLNGHSAALNATLAAGQSARLALSGNVPLRPSERMNLHLTGTADLATFNPILLASGRQARGALSVDMSFGGTLAAPLASGGARVTGGEVQDFARGVRVEGIDATLTAQGRRLEITKVWARAGPGFVTGRGTIDLGAPGFPVDFTSEAHDARPVESDLMTATLSGTLKLSGKLDGAMSLAGTISVTRGEINLPDRFPPKVAVLDVRRRGQKPPVVHLISRVVSLNLTVAAPGRIFVRGRGIDADVGGRIQITGTSDDPQVGGGFTMNHGTLSLAGQQLEFTTGKVSFDGAGVRNRLDPTLDFVAQTSSGGTTATLTLGGYVSAPKITLTSSPQLPQDEILAHLLFQQSVKQLTPLQLAQIAQIIAELGGGPGFNPLGAIRKHLGLDRLAVGSTTGGASGSETQTTVEAGKYVARNIYVGAKQNLSGGTQARVEFDITHNLKAQATLSTATNATVTKGNTAQDNGSSVGLSYQFEY